MSFVDYAIFNSQIKSVNNVKVVVGFYLSRFPMETVLNMIVIY